MRPVVLLKMTLWMCWFMLKLLSCVVVFNLDEVLRMRS